MGLPEDPDEDALSQALLRMQPAASPYVIKNQPTTVAAYLTLQVVNAVMIGGGVDG